MPLSCFFRFETLRLVRRSRDDLRALMIVGTWTPPEPSPFLAPPDLRNLASPFPNSALRATLTLRTSSLAHRCTTSPRHPTSRALHDPRRANKHTLTNLRSLARLRSPPDLDRL